MTALIETWAPRVGKARACRAFGTSPRTFDYRLQAAGGATCAPAVAGPAA